MLGACLVLLLCAEPWANSRPPAACTSLCWLHALESLGAADHASSPASQPGLPQDEADGRAAQAALQGVVGLATALRQRPAAGLLDDTARSGWGAAFYPAGSLQGALAAVLDAAAQQRQLEREGSSGSSRPQAAAGDSGDEHAPEPEDLLFAALQQQALLLGSGEVQAAAARAAEAAAQQQQQQQQQRQQQQAAPAAAGGATAAPQAAATQPAAGTASAQPAQAATTAAYGAAAATPAPAAAGWDPQTEKVPRRKSGPDWWRTLSVLHVAQLLYSDGAKGLMSVHVSVPRTLGSPAAAASSSGSTDGASGSSGQGEEAPTQQLLVAFADIKDAEALADCPVQVCRRGVGAMHWCLGFFTIFGRSLHLCSAVCITTPNHSPVVPSARTAAPHLPHRHPSVERAAGAPAAACRGKRVPGGGAAGWRPGAASRCGLRCSCVCCCGRCGAAVVC